MARSALRILTCGLLPDIRLITNSSDVDPGVWPQPFRVLSPFRVARTSETLSSVVRSTTVVHRICLIPHPALPFDYFLSS